MDRLSLGKIAARGLEDEAEAVIKRTILVSAQDCTYTNTSSDLFDGERYANVFTPDSGFIFSSGTASQSQWVGIQQPIPTIT